LGEEGQINFIANYGDWVAIKKLKIEPATEPKTVMEFLAGLTTGMERKIEHNLRKIVELDRLDKALAEIEAGKRDWEAVLSALNSRAVSSVIKEITEIEELQKNEKKELADFCKVYAVKKMLKESGMEIDYSQIKIPGMKKLKKARV
jgi:hypothetical protein